VSDDVTCDHCGLLGWRRRGHVAPEGWYFASFALTGEDHDPGDLLIVSACSEVCRDALWTKMAGHRWDTIERRVDVPAELRRAAHRHERRLREEARRIRTGSWPSDGTTAGEAFAEVLEQTANALALATERRIASLEVPADGDACPQGASPTAPSQCQQCVQEIAPGSGVTGEKSPDDDTRTDEPSEPHFTDLIHVPIDLVRHVVRCAVLMELQPGRETWPPAKRANVVTARVIDQLSRPREPLREDADTAVALDEALRALAKCLGVPAVNFERLLGRRAL
jgi:hypothetical protein